CPAIKSLHHLRSQESPKVMNPTSLKAAICLNLAAILLMVAPAARAGVVYIDKLTTLQTNAVTFDSSTNTTIASVAAVGGFRTINLTSTNNDDNLEESRLRVLTNSAGGGPRLALGSGLNATANFTVTWGGANGTAGLGGVDFRDGIAATNFSLVTSTLNFSLLTSDITNSITWTFTDTIANTATYDQSIPSKPVLNPITQYSVSLNSFVGAGSVNWSSINFITLSGGGVPSLDLTLGGAFSVTANTIPEPGTWAAAGLLVLTAFYIRRRRIRAASEEAPTAA
ncbi:MAG: PEP-CTERM sorting domain-containing protein, partial [Chthoniobacterales bacterium]